MIDSHIYCDSSWFFRFRFRFHHQKYHGVLDLPKIRQDQCLSVHYFSNNKAWMISDIETVLDRLNRRMNFENRKVILFLDNATCHPKQNYSPLKNI